MIALVLAMVWTRRGQAVTLALLSLFAVAAAVAAPAYMRAADRAVAAGQIATALPAERGITVRSLEDDRNGVTAPDNTGGSFAGIAAALLELPGFTYVHAAEYDTIGIEPGPQVRTRFTYRQDACAHLVMVSGRCLIGEGDVVIGEQTARRLSLAAGAPITLTFAEFSKDPRTPRFEPFGAPKRLTVVGVYRVPDPAATYWGAHGYFARDAGDRAGEPVFASDATMTAMDHGLTRMSIDGVAGPGALDVDNLAALRAGLARATGSAGALGAAVRVDTAVPALLDRIEAGRAAARVIVPVVAVPLVLLACLSIYLAVGYGTEGRRPELAVVALRGERWWGRWWLATGESLVAIVAGAVAGCLAGQLLVDVAAATLLPGGGAGVGLGSLRYAPVAAGAALVAAVLAQRRQLLSPVAELLRRAPAPAAGVRGLAVEAAVLVLAVVCVVQLQLSGGELTGLGLLAPAFVALALAVLAARAALPVITRAAARALRRGRLGPALAGFQLTRRPGAARLLTLLVAAVAVAGYAACAVDVAARGRAVAATVGNGAPRVVTVTGVTRSALLQATRAVDPDGAYAMAVVRLPSGTIGAPSGLAVDSTRLAAVAAWPAGGPSAETVARRLHPAAPAPVVFGGQDLTVDVTAGGTVDRQPVRLGVAVSSVAGLGDTVVQLGTLRPGDGTYQLRTPVCREGCRLKGIQLAGPGQGSALDPGVEVTVRGLRTVNPRRVALEPAGIGEPGRWRPSGGAVLAGGPDGLRVRVETGLPGGAWIQPADTPSPLPVAASGVDLAGSLAGFDGRSTTVDAATVLPAVPRAGTGQVLADLEYLDRISTDTGQASEPQVWLGPRAPADVLERLTARGMVVTGDVTADQLGRQLDEQGPALALWFYALAGGLAVLLAAGALVLAAAVDRARRVEDLSALRAQGLGRGPLSRATLWTYPVLVLAAVVAGLLITLLLWWLTGWALPLAGLDPPPLPLPGRPRPVVLAGAGVLILAVLAGVAFAAGRRIHQDVA